MNERGDRALCDSDHRTAEVVSSQPSLPPADAGGSALSDGFHAWLKRVSKTMTWDWKHQLVVIEKLKAVTEGRCKRLMIFMPPRHGKSELVTVRYSAYRMLQDPSMNIILGSYNQDLANRFSRKVRRVIADSVALDKPSVPAALSEPSVVTDGERSIKNRRESNPPLTSGGSDMFPFASSRPANRVSEWETAAGGGFRAVGVGSGVTGFGANLIVIDDPVKNRAQAESSAFRNRAYEWYTDDISTRLEPDGAMILIQTRWHEDDLAGRILRDTDEYNLEKWDVVNLPALAEPTASAVGKDLTDQEPEEKAEPTASAVGIDLTDQEPEEKAEPTASAVGEELTHQQVALISEVTSQPSIPPAHAGGSALDWRTPGEALCPERFDVESLELTRRRLGSYSFSALYQQQPSPSHGAVFDREWFKIIPYAPEGLKWARGYDLAIATHENADYTASLRCAFDDAGNLYIADGFRDRIDFPAQRRYVIERMRAEPDTIHGIEKALHGQGLVSDLRSVPEIRGEALLGVDVTSNKLARALTWAPIAEEGKCFLISGRNASVNERGDRPAEPAVEITVANTRTITGWIREFLSETAAFPVGSHDDQIDAVSIAVHLLMKPRYRSGGF